MSAVWEPRPAADSRREAGPACLGTCGQPRTLCECRQLACATSKHESHEHESLNLAERGKGSAGVLPCDANKLRQGIDSCGEGSAGVHVCLLRSPQLTLCATVPRLLLACEIAQSHVFMRRMFVHWGGAAHAMAGSRPWPWMRLAAAPCLASVTGLATWAAPRLASVTGLAARDAARPVKGSCRRSKHKP